MIPSRDSVKLKHISVIVLLSLFAQFVSGNLYKVQRNVLPRAAEASSGKLEFSFNSVLNNLQGKSGQGYYMQVEIGTPPTQFNIIVDTGSSNFAVACAPHSDVNKFFNTSQSSSYRHLGTRVEVPYTEGSWKGSLGQDYVSFPSMPGLKAMANIACITQSQGFFINGSNWQGIMGLAYAKLARPDSSVVPLFDSMVAAGLIDNQMTVQLCGTHYNESNPDLNMGGTMVFGGVDTNQTLYSTPVVKQWYYEVVIVDMEVAGQSLKMDCKEYNFGRTIVDTGTTNLRLPTRVFNTLVNSIKQYLMKHNTSIPGDKFWSGDEVLCWNNSQVPYMQFPEMSIILPQDGTTAFRLIISAQQYLRSVGPEYENNSGPTCYKFGISSLQQGSVLGAVVMEGFYVVIDRATSTVKFGESECKVPLSSRIMGNISYTGNYADCEYHEPDVGPNLTVAIVGYVMAGITGLCLLPLLVLAIRWQARKLGLCKRRLYRQNSDQSDLMNTG